MSAPASAVGTDSRGLLRERRGSTLILTLNRPAKMNALSAGLVEAMLGAVQGAHRDGTRLLVLRGAGRNFSAGFDMDGLEEQSDADLVLRFIRIEQLLQAVRHAPFDTLALAHGRNFGAGVDLFCACARRFATAGATFRMPGLKFGLALGTRLFAERVGPERARQVLQASRTFTASEAAAWGFAKLVSETNSAKMVSETNSEKMVSDTSSPEMVSETDFEALVSKAEGEGAGLAPQASERLFRLTSADRRDADLAELVRSAAEPGLKARIAAYLQAKG